MIFVVKLVNQIMQIFLKIKFAKLFVLTVFFALTPFAVFADAKTNNSEIPAVKVFQLDQNKQEIKDIYETVKTQDGNWATVGDGQYVRVTFSQALEAKNDITIYAKPTDQSKPATINVYKKDTTELVGTFDSINHEGSYKLLLSSLLTPTEAFDLKISGSVDVDYITDPSYAYTVLRNFGGSAEFGAKPYTPLTVGSDGLYGVSGPGYGGGNGFLYRFNPVSGNMVILHTFTSGSYPGPLPYALIISGSVLYGVGYGGASGNGVLFKINTDGTGLTVLYNFTSSNTPQGPLTLVGSTLYGVAGYSSSPNSIYRVNIDGTGFTSLYSFRVGDSLSGDNLNPYLTVSGSIIYGSTNTGGTNGGGTIFKMNTDGSGFSTIYNFQTTFAGSGLVHGPIGQLVLSGSTLFGTTTHSSYEWSGGGAIFKVNVNGTGYAILREFLIGSGDGYAPGGLTLAGSFIYGTTRLGGGYGGGSLFRLSGDAQGQSYTALYSLPKDSYSAGDPVSYNSKIYGTNHGWLDSEKGSIFEYDISSSGGSIVYNFPGTAYDSNVPVGGLLDMGNVFYGVTEGNGVSYGPNNLVDFGTIFSIKSDGTKLSYLHSFTGTTTKQGGGYVVDGKYPTGAPTTRYHDYYTFYGMTYGGGNLDGGTIYSISPSNGNYYSVLHSFNLNAGEGYHPTGGLTPHGNGLLYGTTYDGGANGAGTIFEFNPSTNGFRTIHTFTNALNDGSHPRGTLIIYNQNLYGMTYSGGSNGLGTIYSIGTNGAFTVLHSFTGSATDGAYPEGSLTPSGDKFYGMTSQGGVYGAGTVFSFDFPTSTFTVLHSFRGGANDGANPGSSLLISDGVVYGATAGGGAYGSGVIFSINNNNYAVLRSFPNQTGSIAYASDNNFIKPGNLIYGVADSGGSSGGGVMFSMTINSAPYFLALPSDGPSSATTSTKAGNNVTFTATAVDSESDNYYLALCKTSSITPNNSAAPTCGGGSWCVSGSTASGLQATCDYTTSESDVGGKTWYAFLCDNSIDSKCSASAQNAGDANNGSPFVVVTAIPPRQSGWSPANNASITTSTPTITFNLNRTGDCFAATTDWSYDEMVAHTGNGAVDCTENGLAMTCTNVNVGSSAGAKHVYISCEDYPTYDKDTSTSNTDLTYTYVASAPTVTLTAAQGVVSRRAIISGDVTDNSYGNTTVTMYWGTSDGGINPSSWQNSVSPTGPTQPQGIATFYKYLSGLSPNTTYYFSAKATNAAGTSWPAASLSFTTTAIAYVSTPSAWFLPYSGGDAVKINTVTGSMLGFSSGGYHWGTAVDAQGNAWATRAGSGYGLRKYNSSGSLIGDYTAIATGAHALAIDASGNVWVTKGAQVLKVSSSGQLMGTFNVGSGFDGIAVDASGDIWASDLQGGNVVKLNYLGGLIGTYAITGNPAGIAIDSFGNAWVASWNGSGQNGYVTKLSSSGSIIGRYPVGITPEGVAIDPFGNIWIANSGSGSVTKLSSSGSLIGTYSVGGSGIRPEGISVDLSGNVWVPIYNSNRAIKLSSSGDVLANYGVNYAVSIGDFTGFALQYFVLGYNLPSKATTTLSAPSSVTSTSATVNGNITATGNDNPTVTMYWGTTDGGQTPASWAHSVAPTSPSQPQGAAAFHLDLDSLTPGTRYYFSASAVNSMGTSWPSASLSFTTGTAPRQSGWNPANNAHISNTAPAITFNLNKAGDCFASWSTSPSTNDYSYDDMVANSQTDCSENGLAMICQMPPLGDDGTKYIHIACEDYPVVNKDTSATNTDLTYVLDTHAPTVSFTDDVVSGPTQSNTVTPNWGGADVKLWDYDLDGTCSTSAGDYQKTDADLLTQATEANNGEWICLYGADLAGNYSTRASAHPINIDVTPPTLSFSDDVSAGPVTSEVISANWDVTASVDKWMYSDSDTCSTTSTDYTIGTDIPTQSTQAHNSKWICLYTVDALGNFATRASAHPINVDVTPPAISFSDDVSSVVSTRDTVVANWDNAPVIKWGYFSSDTCSTDPNNVNYTSSSSSIDAQNTEANNGKWICLYAADSLGNFATRASAHPINIDVTAPYAYFTNNVEVGPISLDSVAVEWGGADVHKWGYFPSQSCSTDPNNSNYAYSTTLIPDQNTQANNGKYICIYAADTAGNIKTQYSSYPLNIDFNPPMQYGWSPIDNSVITTSTPTVSFSVDKTGICYIATSDWGYDDMIAHSAMLCSINGLTVSCASPDLSSGGDGAKHLYISCESAISLNKDTSDTNTNLTYNLDTTAPIPSGFNPTGGTTITTATPTITFGLNENGDCYAGTADESYDTMVTNDRTNCSGDGTRLISCTMSPLGTDSSKTIYFSCKDSAGNKDTDVTNHSVTYTLDTTAPTLSFTNDVLAGPVTSNQITAVWGDDTYLAKWTYNASSTCPTASTSYSYGTTDIPTQTTQANNGKWICLYAEDAYGNKRTLASGHSINIDITPPTISFTDDVALGPVSSDTIKVDEVNWGGATVRKWDYFSSDSCSTNINDYNNAEDASMSQTSEAHNGEWICLYAADALGNFATKPSAHPINIDTTAPSISFEKDVLEGPVTFNDIKAIWGTNVTVKKWGYFTSQTCPTTSTNEGYSNYTDQFRINTQANNGKWICLYAEDNLGNKATLPSGHTINIDVTGPALAFTDDVAGGPVRSDTITANWDYSTNATAKWNYSTSSTCPTNPGNDAKDSTVSMDQSAQTNNGKWICLYGQDSLGNATVKRSAHTININTTGPTLLFTNNVEAGPVLADTISANWGGSTDVSKKWIYNSSATCPADPGENPNDYSVSINQTDQSHNGKWICLYGQDSLGNKSVLASARPININIAPVMGVPSDGGSSATSQTLTGGDVTFTVTGTDSDSNNYYLAICKTNVITAHNNTAPTCATSQTWCVSGSTASGSQATCTHTAVSADVGSKNWYAFVCDYNLSSACSASSQGSGDNGSPFVVAAASYLNQTGYKIYQDDAGLNSATYYALENKNYNISLSTNFRIRFKVANTGSGAGDIARRLEFKEGSGSWTQITTNSNNVRLADSSNYTDATATTGRLTSAGTFTAGQGKDTGSDTSLVSLGASHYTEDEFAIKFQATASGKTYQFRITNAGTALDGYLAIPTIAPGTLPSLLKMEGVLHVKGGLGVKSSNPYSTYTVIYDANGATSGTVPVDSNAYALGNAVTVKTNSGNLAKTGYGFSGWNTLSTGTGIDRPVSSTFVMGTGNINLYAKWSARPVVTEVDPPASSTGDKVVILGSNFTGATSVEFGIGNSAAAFTVDNDYKITVIVPMGTCFTTVDVIVATSSGSSAISDNDHFTYQCIDPICISVLDLEFEDGNGVTTIADSSGSNHTFTANSGAYETTSKSFAGSGSFYSNNISAWSNGPGFDVQLENNFSISLYALGGRFDIKYQSVVDSNRYWRFYTESTSNNGLAVVFADHASNGTYTQVEEFNFLYAANFKMNDANHWYQIFFKHTLDGDKLYIDGIDMGFTQINSGRDCVWLGTDYCVFGNGNDAYHWNSSTPITDGRMYISGLLNLDSIKIRRGDIPLCSGNPISTPAEEGWYCIYQIYGYNGSGTCSSGGSSSMPPSIGFYFSNQWPTTCIRINDFFSYRDIAAQGVQIDPHVFTSCGIVP